MRLKDVAELVVEQLPPTTPPDFAFRYLDIGTVGTGRLKRPPVEITFGEAPSRARQRVQAGDVIISTVRTYLKSVLLITRRTADYVVSTGFAVLRPRHNVDQRWLGYLLQTPGITDEVVRRSDGVAYPAVRPDRLMSLPIIIPGSDMQLAAVRYLDHVELNVSRAIESRRALVSLLNERRQNVVRELVTCGTRPNNGGLRSSGVQWLGDVPADWDIRPAK
jgi:type I restriction enzyme S subunit